MNSSEDSPLFLRIAHQLKQRLASGQYPVGIPLPGERALAQDWGVARVTIRSALQRLQEEGLVTRLRGVGTMPVAAVSTSSHAKLQTGLLESIVSFGQRTRTHVISYAFEPACQEVAQALQIKPGIPVLKIVRVRTAKKQPLQCTEAYLPEDIARLVKQIDLNDIPILSLIARAGRQFARGEQALDAVHAPAAAARLLKVDENMPVLRVKRIVFDLQDRPIQYLVGHYASSRYQYQMSMSRTGGGTKVWITA